MTRIDRVTKEILGDVNSLSFLKSSLKKRKKMKKFSKTFGNKKRNILFPVNQKKSIPKIL